MRLRHVVVAGKSGVITGLIALALAATAETASAQTASTTFSVTATVNNRCTISATSIAFGVYDPVVAHAATPLDAEGTVTIQCTRNTVATIGLDAGTNGASAVGTTRAMQNAGAFLSYEIYQNALRSTLWGNSGADLFPAGAAPNAAPRTFSMYGRIPAGQDVPPGSYTDTVTATVNF